MSDQHAEAKKLSDLKQSEVEKYQEMKSSLFHQIKLNVKTIARLTEQINDIKQKGNVFLCISYYCFSNISILQ